MTSPLDVACPYSQPGIDGKNCGAASFDPCQWLPAGEFHAERIAIAIACSGETAGTPTEDEMAVAVTDLADSGLF